MTTSLGVIHNEYKGLQGSLLFKPVPFVLWVVCKIINLSNIGWDNPVCSYKIIGVNRAAVAQSQRTIFEHWVVECSPRAVIVRKRFGV
jgi:hypothetical protein